MSSLSVYNAQPAVYELKIVFKVVNQSELHTLKLCHFNLVNKQFPKLLLASRMKYDGI